VLCFNNTQSALGNTSQIVWCTAALAWPSGTNTIQGVLDVTNVIAESNENNNSVNRTYTPCALSDAATAGSGIALDGANKTLDIYRFACQYYLINTTKTMYPGGPLASLNNPAGVLITHNALLNNNNTPSSANIVSDPSGDGNFNDNTGLRAAVSAHNFTEIVYDYYLSIHNRNSWNNQGGSLISFVHGIPTSTNGLPNNAFWNGAYVTYGGGDGVTFSNWAGSLDLVAHEITHGVTQADAGLVYEVQSGALNESFSDVFGVLIDSDDWLIGDAIKLPNGALRSMENPTLYNQPDHMDNYVTLPNDKDHDWGGVHTNSGIPNKAFYLAATSLNREKAGKIWYRTLVNYMTPNSQFIDCANLAVQSAGDLYGGNSPERQAVRNAFRQVGILSNSSPQITSTPPANATVNILYSYQIIANDADGDPLMYALTVKPTSMTINSTGLVTWTPTQANPSVPVTARITDGFGGSKDQSWTITVTGGGNIPKITGGVNYYKNNTPVRDVSMALTGAAIQTVSTGVDGRYEFANLTNGSNYMVMPSKTGSVGSAVSAFDAAQVLQHTVGIITLDANQQKAADVSNAGGVSAFDAALILQYTVGIITSFPAGGWGFVPGSKSYAPLSSGLLNENYLGVVYGDVSGNWTGTTAALSKAEHQAVQLVLAPLRLQDEKQLRVPLMISASEKISGLLIRLALDFDHNLLRDVELSDGNDAGLVTFSGGEHTVALAAAFVTGRTEQQVDLIFVPEVLGQSLEVTSLAVNDENALTMSEKVVLQIEAVELPKNFELTSNYPNPFNAGTTIQIRLPKATEVEIRVFNLHGQLVKLLWKGYLEAGTHRLEWNGRDEAGLLVASGVFILEMNAGQFHARRKISLLK